MRVGSGYRFKKRKSGFVVEKRVSLIYYLIYVAAIILIAYYKTFPLTVTIGLFALLLISLFYKSQVIFDCNKQIIKKSSFLFGIRIWLHYKISNFTDCKILLCQTETIDDIGRKVYFKIVLSQVVSGGERLIAELNSKNQMELLKEAIVQETNIPVIYKDLC